MAKPVILIVDDEPEVLNAVERDLRRHFKGTYRIVKAGSGKDALDATHKLKERGASIALFLSDERMPNMSGTEFLKEAQRLYPDARKALLTAYADTEAAITAINDIGLNHYLLKPWDPPEERLYPVLDDLLSDWSANVIPDFDGLRVVGANWSSTCYDAREFLSRNQVPYQWIDVDSDQATRELVDKLTEGKELLPVLLFPDGTHLVAPARDTLAEKVGMQTRAKKDFYDMAIIGGGPAGLAAAVYGASEGLKTILLEMNAPGGQAGTSSAIENYLGFPSGVSGADLARRAVTQAKRFGAELVYPQEVVEVRREDPYRILKCKDGTEISCYALVMTAGVEVRMLEVEGAEKFAGKGVFYGAAMTEAATYRDQDIVIVGAANSAGQGAMFFSNTSSKVTMLVRGDSLEKSMSQYLIDRIRATENMEVLLNTEVVAVKGNDKVEALQIKNNKTGEISDLPTSAMFVFIGAQPRTDILGDLVEKDEKGYIVTGHDIPVAGKRPRGWVLERDPYLFETSVPGIFAAGDVRAGSGKRVAASVGEGSATVSMVHAYLKTV